MNLPTHPHLETRHEDQVLWISLNNPAKMNCMRDDMLEVFCAIVDAIENDDTVSVVVVRGNGPCFSSGYDISKSTSTLRENNAEASRRFFTRRYAFIDRVWNSPKPFIASVHGYCLAAASDLANTCDVTIAADDAVFGYPAVRWGGHTHRLTYPWHMPFKKAKGLMLTGDRMDAIEAERVGMINKVVPRDRLEEETRAMAARMVMIPLSGLIVNKISMNYAFDSRGYQQAMQYSFQIAETNQWRKNKDFWGKVENEGLGNALNWRDGKFGDRKPE